MNPSFLYQSIELVVESRVRSPIRKALRWRSLLPEFRSNSKCFSPYLNRAADNQLCDNKLQKAHRECLCDAISSAIKKELMLLSKSKTTTFIEDEQNISLLMDFTKQMRVLSTISHTLKWAFSSIICHIYPK